jgi:hypothetical protein
MEEFDEIDNTFIDSNDEYDSIEEENSDYGTDSDDEGNQSNNENIVQSVNSGVQFAQEIKFLEKKYSTTQIVKYHGYKFEQERILIYHCPLLPIFTFNGNEYLYKRDAFSTYKLFYSMNEIRQTKSSLRINPNIISIDDSYLFACRKKNLANWNRHFITIKRGNYMSIFTSEDLDVLLNYKNTLTNKVQQSHPKYSVYYELSINWILKILIGVLNFNAIFKPLVLTEYLKLSGIKIKKEYEKRRKNVSIKINNNIKDGNEFTRKSSNYRKKLCRKNKNEVKQNNSKSGSNSKIDKTYEAMRVLEEKAIVQRFQFNQNSADKEISPSFNIKTSFT